MDGVTGAAGGGAPGAELVLPYCSDGLVPGVVPVLP